MIEVELPDGTIVEFPEGTSQDVMLKALRSLTNADPRQAMRDRIAAAKAGTLQASPESLARASQADQIAQDQATLSQVGGVGGFATKAVQGLPFVGEYSDELTGAIGRGAEAVGIASPGTGERAMNMQRQVQDAYQRQNPGKSLAAGLVGGVVGSAPLAAVAGPSILAKAPASLLGRSAAGIVAGATAGGVEGAVSGYGAGNDGNRAESAAERGAIGAGLGGIIGGAAPVAAAGIRKVVERLKGQDVAIIRDTLGVSTDAARVIKAQLDSDDFAAAAASIQRAGPDAMLADAGPAASQLLDTAMQSGGAATRIGRDAVETRAEAAGRRVTAMLDSALGKPIGVQGLKKSIKDSTAKARQDFYNKAFSVEIDWNSPAGAELRQLLATTPDDVLRRAARSSAMAARADDMTAKYASEFEPTISRKPGEMSGDYAGKQEVNAFFDAYREATSSRMMKRPFTNLIKKRGGLDPSSPLASDLRAMGITPQSTPGLFRVGGLKDVDNLDTSGLPDVLRAQVDDGGLYVNRQAIVDALQRELSGEAVEDMSDTLGREMSSELERLKPEYEAKRLAIAKAEKAMARGPTAPDAPANIVPMKTVKDIDAIKRALDEIDRTNDGLGLMGGKTEYGMEAGRRAREIRDLLAEISPVYKKALAESADTISRVKAVELGAKLLSRAMTREEVAEFAAKATKGERAAAIQGLRQQIDDMMANVTPALSRVDFSNAESVTAAEGAVKAVKQLASRANMEKVAAVLGPSRSKVMFKALDEAAAQFQQRLNVARNSATASRLAGQQAVKDITEPGALGSLMQGEPVQAFRKVVQVLTGNTKAAQSAKSQQIYAEIARALTQMRGPAAQSALKSVQDAMSGQPIKSADAVRIARLLTSSAALGGYQLGQQRLARQ